jgi:mono/diheme cytochrome c family protein
MKKRTLALTSVLLLAGAVTLLVAGEGDPWPSIWDGVYTTAQATRGEAIYRAKCGSCHGANLEGLGGAPPLVGKYFTWDWDGTGVDNLYEKIYYTMPDDRINRLTPKESADVLGYLLKMNRFPEGPRELAADAENLRTIRFEEGRGGLRGF